MGTTKKKLSIDELARRLSNEFVPENLDKEMWRRESNDWIVSWHRVVRLARKLEAQPAPKPRPVKQKTLADLPYIEVVVHQPVKTEGCEVTWSVAEPRPKAPPSNEIDMRVQLMLEARREQASLARARAAKKARK